MIVSRLNGGLGNQMFQYAVARALEDKNRNIYLDTSFLDVNKVAEKNFTPRNYELSIFENIRASFLSNFRKNLILNKHIIFKILRHIKGVKVRVVKQNETEFITFPDKTYTLYLAGFFQSEKYFRSIRSDLLRDFTFPELDQENKLLGDRIFETNSICIHVRRGDYLNSAEVLKYHGVLPLSYYHKAIALLTKEVTENVHYYIFSEDKEYIEANFAFLSNSHFVNGNSGKDSWKDLSLMRMCKHHIIANSSFSWWGAWLSDRDGITISPAHWFNPQNVSFDIHNFIPDNWLIMDCESV